MKSLNINDITSLKNLASLKEFCNSHLLEIATDGLGEESQSVKIRFIDLTGNFGYTNLGRFFYVEDCMYLITKDEKYQPDHNPDILDFNEDLEFLKFTNYYIARVIFAGIFTGFYDDMGKRIFTGDVVDARVLLNPAITSTGGESRAKSSNEGDYGTSCEAGVNVIFDSFSIILDNHSIPLSWAKKIKIVGSLFFELEPTDIEVDIQSLCSRYAQSRTDSEELRKLIKKSPYFLPVR